jgi:hypothetical protein
LAESARAAMSQLPEVPATAQSLVAGGWDPMRFVDLCEAALRQPGALAAACLTLQDAEWRELFNYCYRAAVGNVAVRNN